MFFLYVYLCTMCMPSGQGSQKKALNLLELELWTVLGAGNGIPVLCKTSKCFSLWSQLSSASLSCNVSVGIPKLMRISPKLACVLCSALFRLAVELELISYTAPPRFSLPVPALSFAWASMLLTVFLRLFS